MRPQISNGTLTYEDFKKIILNDFRIASESRQASLIGRKEVLTGKAKFGIFGDGKEVAQIAMAKAFMDGDFRSGYYRDQTFMFAAGLLSLEEFFAQLYAVPDTSLEPSSGGRQMNGHYGTRLLNDDGTWKDLTKLKNSSADISPTAGQMPRLLGLAYASKLYRLNKNAALKNSNFTIKGNEVAFGTIGDASTSEGLFFETINAAGVLQVPLAISVWDDGYGISVAKKFQTTKESISEVLKGFERGDEKDGFLIYKANGWDYPGLCEMYEKGIALCRANHIPVLFHVQEMTQPQGHSTSGSHERYKSEDRLKWEEKHDCIRRMREWIIQSAIASNDELEAIESAAKKRAQEARKNAWEQHIDGIKIENSKTAVLLEQLSKVSNNGIFISKIASELLASVEPERKEISIAIKKSLRYSIGESSTEKLALIHWMQEFEGYNKVRYDSNQYSQSNQSIFNIEPVLPIYNDDSPLVDGREVLQANFDFLLSNLPELVAFGEDVGGIGGVNQTYAGLQQKYGDHRVIDTGIREATIIGQGIGLALRGFRPIAEIQYLDYLAYAIQVLTDDLACLQYRTRGGQKAPLIISTRGHRLEGVWHSGSPLQMILGAIRGIHCCVPRNMTQAAGFYNTILSSDEPALVIEPLNAYRIKEKLPVNIGEFKIPLGVPDILREGNDVTIVTYGSLCRIAEEACKQLSEIGIECELVDVQTLLPFDINHIISQSIQKTNKVLFLDEDVPGGGCAFMLQQVLDGQNAYQYLDAQPRTLSAKEHRPAYGSDGDYWSKPQIEDIFDIIYTMMSDYDPQRYPKIY